MFVLKVVVFLALVYASAADDGAYWMLTCAKEAITKGVPELNIPSHNPLVFKREFTLWANSSSAHNKVHLKNVVWNKIASFDYVIRRLEIDGKTTLYNITLAWQGFSLDADYNLTGQTGKISTKFTDFIVSGTFTTEQHSPRDQNQNIKFTDMDVNQFNEKATVVATNNDKLAGYLYYQIVDAFNIHKYKSVIIDFLNNFSNQPERVNRLIAWCKKQ